MPDQSTALTVTPAEARSMVSLTRTVNSCTPMFWRDENGTLMAMTTRRDGDFGYLYRFNADEGRWNDAGRACGHGVPLDEECDGCDEGNSISDGWR